jgi:hypothetical protein
MRLEQAGVAMAAGFEIRSKPSPVLTGYRERAIRERRQDLPFVQGKWTRRLARLDRSCRIRGDAFSRSRIGREVLRASA